MVFGYCVEFLSGLRPWNTILVIYGWCMMVFVCLTLYYSNAFTSWFLEESHSSEGKRKGVKGRHYCIGVLAGAEHCAVSAERMEKIFGSLSNSTDLQTYALGTLGPAARQCSRNLILNWIGGGWAKNRKRKKVLPKQLDNSHFLDFPLRFQVGSKKRFL